MQIGGGFTGVFRETAAMILRVIVAALIGAGATAQPLAAQRTASAPLAGRVDSLVSSYMATTRTPAVSVAVVRGPDTLVMKGFGKASLDLDRPATASTIYRIGSITKQFTAAEILRLAERGKLTIDDPFTTYLPDVPAHGRTITIRQLLNQTSGIHEIMAEPAWRSTASEQLSPRQVVAFVDHDSLDFDPGTAWKYSNTNYVLLGMIIEKVTGESYANYLQHDLFAPLGLARTSYCLSRPSDPSVAAGYSAGPDGVKPTRFLDMSHPHAAGALCSTVRDLVTWQRELAGGRVVDAESYALMTTPDTLINGTRLTYGFGFDVGALGTHPEISHGGALDGFVAMANYYPADGLNVVVLTNADRGPDAKFLGPTLKLLAGNIARAVFSMPLVR
jgi:D-alanyl-D-alanine carboxypeptidase